MRSLYPDSVERVSGLPWFLQAAIEHGLTVLNWMENLPKKEVPPKHIWADPEGLELWWKKLDEQRSDGSARGASSDDEDDAGTDNDLARAFRER